MNNFISSIRTDREREIRKKQQEGILIGDTNKYRYVSIIDVIIGPEEKYSVGVQANRNDLFFFVIDNEGNSYYTIVDIYEILLKAVYAGNRDSVIDTLNKMIEIQFDADFDEEDDKKDAGKFEYKGVVYYMKPLVIPEYDGIIEMDNGGSDLSYKHLFILLNLIQEKSNALFRRGKGGIKYGCYTNGLLRLFVALIVSEKDHDELGIRGWKFDDEKNIFIHVPIDDNDKELNIKKYYLTEEELSNIIKSES